MSENRLRHIAAALAASLLISGCDSSDNDIADNIVGCDLENSYVTKNLYQAEDGQYSHGIATFSGGQVEVQQAGTTVEGNYTCDGSFITATFPDTEEIPIQANKQGEEIEFSPPQVQQTLTFSEADVSADNPWCEQVAGKTYKAEGLTAQAANEDTFAAESPFFSFAENGTVDFSIEGAQIHRGIYDCATQMFHVHGDAQDDTPIHVQVVQQGEFISTEIDGNSETFASSEPEACLAIYDPVCSVNLTPEPCESEPCPIGRYQTYPNRCKSDADGALFYSEGECGEMEGEPFYNEQTCPDGDASVCAAVTVKEPCGSIPCPNMIHQTFSNECEAQSASGFVLSEGECNDLEGEPVEQLTGGCIAVVDPVCTKVKQPEENCETEPCGEYLYETFSNSCQANLARATTVLAGECGALADWETESNPPVQVTDNLPSTDKTPTVQSAQVDGQQLTVTLSYAGCSEQHFDLFASSTLDGSDPATAETRFIPMVEDECEAQFTTQFTYDLLPLRKLYMDNTDEQSGEIDLGELGTYQF